jgi:1,4-dihydroxy-2-naphthoate polyprenyltransferase
MNSVKIWTLASRPKTLIASISPVLMGTSCAMTSGSFDPLLFFFTLLTALGIQIGTNLANDYFDAIKGADTEGRKGPLRVTQSKLVTPLVMKRAILITFSLTALFGLYLVWQGGPLFAFLLALSIALGILYTGGPYPLAYMGLGDLFVLLFYGPAALIGTFALQTHSLSLEVALLSLAPAAFSIALLNVNNLRDIEEDRKADKKTMVVRLGPAWGISLYCGGLTFASLLPLSFIGSHPFASLAVTALIPATLLMRTLFQPEPHYNLLLAKTAQLFLVYTLLLCIGWMI